MIHIALCDDDPLFLQRLHQTVNQWFTEHKILFTCCDYLSGNDLSDTCRTTCFDLFFLDIEMPETNGMQLAKNIREMLPDSIIIFLTSHDEYAPEGYHVQALRYLSKLTWKNHLDEALQAAVSQLEKRDRGALCVSHYGNIQRIPYNDILYVRHLSRYSQIVTKTGKMIQDDRGIKKLFEIMGNRQFLFIDRGTFINLDHIQKIENRQALMADGALLPISRRLISQVKLSINRYYGG